MKRQVLITAPIPDASVERIAAVSPDLVIERLAIPKEGWPAGYVTAAEVHYTAGQLLRPEQAPQLRWVHSHWAGVEGLIDSPLWAAGGGAGDEAEGEDRPAEDNEDIGASTGSRVVLTTTSGIHAPNIGQYVLAQMLAWANRVPRWLRAQREGTWPQGRRDTFMSEELAGQTLGIIGYGSIGREIARLARVFNMTILVTKRDARHVQDTGYTLPGFGDPDGTMPTRIYPAGALRSVVAQCDYVAVTLPLTAHTHHLFDESVFQTMKPSAYVINVGRGGVIDEHALIRALQRGWIAGAGLDVFETEPLSDSSPLWDMRNVILTPHVSGMTPHYEERAADLFTANLRRYLAGEPLINAVDWQEGY